MEEEILLASWANIMCFLDAALGPFEVKAQWMTTNIAYQSQEVSINQWHLLCMRYMNISNDYNYSWLWNFHNKMLTGQSVASLDSEMETKPAVFCAKLSWSCEHVKTSRWKTSAAPAEARIKIEFCGFAWFCNKNRCLGSSKQNRWLGSSNKPSSMYIQGQKEGKSTLTFQT